MTRRDDRQPFGSVGTELTVAVELIDVYTGGRPISPATVSLAGKEATFRRGPSGYYVLQDVPEVPDPVAVAVNAPGYLPATASKELSDLDELYPVVSVDLLPGPNYEFGAGETLIRGRVEDGGPVRNADVSIDGRSDKTFCDDRGEFVLWFETLDADDVRTTDEGERFVEIDGDDPRIRAERSTGTTAVETVELEVGSTASVTISF